MSVILLGIKKPTMCVKCSFAKPKGSCIKCALCDKEIDDIYNLLPECPIEEISEGPDPEPVEEKESDVEEAPCTPPPLGIMPRNIWEEKRRQDIVDAMKRYADANAHIPADWINELYDLEYRL